PVPGEPRGERADTLRNLLQLPAHQRGRALGQRPTPPPARPQPGHPPSERAIDVEKGHVRSLALPPRAGSASRRSPEERLEIASHPPEHRQGLPVLPSLRPEARQIQDRGKAGSPCAREPPGPVPRQGMQISAGAPEGYLAVRSHEKLRRVADPEQRKGTTFV